ncbi:UNVERIFIED_CONTAM: Kolavenyl diphosphate synthase TPS5, chloroplastic [Sesamum calycinum]|uniref:Kolavenyl diphosphate synthase TPS5, chloroplastic n=1 Tax=Sesamum calycinum TaxID=2727403 RepID=A0AAW2SEZ7_9LAMI
MSEKIGKLVESIRSMLHCMDDGEISVSPYDTAWVALVEDIGHGETPQFPSALDWISSNQLEDESWGDRKTFSAYDRIINTLACVVALRFWKLHPHKCNKGISFLKDNFHKLEDENEEHMTIGFEVALPTLMEIAKKLGFDIPNDFSGLQRIYARRDLKLTRIPWDTMHKVPTTLLYSLEAMSGLDWQKLLKLQSTNGSFLGSPSSTAFALQQTKDENCLKYLLKLVQKFNGGVPNVHPVDLFEHLWVVDRLQRLGISRYFQPEIDEYIDYVSRYWTSRGICCQRNSEVQDIDDTAMGFRLLRLHGYEMCSSTLRMVEFFCFMGQSDQPVTGMYNLYRASQVMFPEEEILADARKFSAKFLQEKRANTKILDKWIIAKDLPGEVGYALDVPWYVSLPRLETRFYLEQYGGEEDAWIGKTLYRMPYVNNNDYLELAKLDYNHCQALHLHEWEIQEERKQAFVNEFRHGSIVRDSNGGRYKTRKGLVGILIRTVSQLSFDAQSVHDKDIYQELNHAWQKWLRTWEEGTDDHDMGQAGDAELFVQTLNLSGGRSSNISRVLDEAVLSHPKYQQLLQVTTRVCHHLRLFQNRKVQEGDMGGGITAVQIETDMQELVKLVLTQCSGDLVPSKSFYYTAYCSPGTINFHIAKVLFDRVI